MIKFPEFHVDITNPSKPIINVNNVLYPLDQQTRVSFFFEEGVSSDGIENLTSASRWNNMLTVEYIDVGGGELYSLLLCDLPDSLVQAWRKYGELSIIDKSRNITLNFDFEFFQ